MIRGPTLPSHNQVVFFDIETTDVNPFESKIITIQVRKDGNIEIWKEWELGEERCIEEFYGFPKYEEALASHVNQLRVCLS